MTLKYALTDDQLGQYYRKMNVIADRLGKSLPFDQVMAALQSIHDGKEPIIPTLIIEPKLASWRKFLIGGVAKKPLLQRVKSGFEVGSYAESLVNNRVFTTLDKEEEIDTIILTPGDFGYERNPTTTELFDPTRLAEWSRQNAHRLPEGCVVELLPAEAGLHIRDQYKDQPKGEVLWITMERITDSGGHPHVFSVERHGGGEQWLYAHWTSPAFGGICPIASCSVFARSLRTKIFVTWTRASALCPFETLFQISFLDQPSPRRSDAPGAFYKLKYFYTL